MFLSYILNDCVSLLLILIDLLNRSIHSVKPKHHTITPFLNLLQSLPQMLHPKTRLNQQSFPFQHRRLLPRKPIIESQHQHTVLGEEPTVGVLFGFGDGFAGVQGQREEEMAQFGEGLREVLFGEQGACCW